MNWYHLLSPVMGKWVAVAVFVVVFTLILLRKFNIAYISVIGGGILILLGIMNPREAFLSSIAWDALAIYWGYAHLAVAFRESRMPTWIANWVLPRAREERHALLFLCLLAMFFSSFMANPVVVIMLSPLAIEIAAKVKGSLFLYLVALAISSNVVTTVSMIADPPATILATTTGMNFWDFYWFQGRIGLGTLSIIGISFALFTLYLQFRKLSNPLDIKKEEVKASPVPLFILFLSVVALAAIPWNSMGAWNHPGLVGVAVGAIALALNRKYVKDMVKETDWNSILFLIGVFVVVGAMNNTGILQGFAEWLGKMGIKSPSVYLAIFIWVSVILSSFIDNVPYTVLMIPVCLSVGTTLGVSPFPFLYGMLVGTGIGGNITPVGATANVIACGILEKRGYKVELKKYMAISVPFSVCSVLAVHILLQIFWL